MAGEQRPVALIIAEHGTDWVAWAERVSRASLDVVVVPQGRDESIPELAFWARGRVARLARQGRSITWAVWLSDATADPDAVAVRSFAVRIVAASMARNEAGTLWLPHTMAAARRATLALARAVKDLSCGSRRSARGASDLLDPVPALA